MRAILSRTFLASVAGLTASALLCGAALVRAFGVSTVTPAPAPTGFASGPEPGSAGVQPSIDAEPGALSGGVLDEASLSIAVDRDPFLPDRHRAEPYRMPGESVSSEVVARPEPPDTPPFHVIGTGSSGESGIALVQAEDADAPEVLRVGDSLRGYRLASVEPETATVVLGGQELRLAVEQGEARAAGDRQRRAAKPDGPTPFPFGMQGSFSIPLTENMTFDVGAGRIEARGDATITTDGSGVIVTQDGSGRRFVFLRPPPDTAYIDQR